MADENELTPPTYYSYARGTKEYLTEGLADQSPMDHEEVVWLMPASSTWIEPPPSQGGSARIFDEETETGRQVRDARGEVWWKDGNQFPIYDLGDPEELGLFKFGPPLAGPTQITRWNSAIGNWETIANYMGQVWWEDHQTPVQIEDYGIDPNEMGLVKDQPEAPPPEETDPIPEPDTLTKRQIVRALILGTAATENPILDPDAFILGALEAIADPVEKALAIQDWHYAPYYLRDHELFSNPDILGASGLSPEMVDQLWQLGKAQPK